MALTGLNPIPPNDLVMGCPPACGGRGSFAKLILSWDLPDVTWLAPPLLKTCDCRVSDLFVYNHPHREIFCYQVVAIVVNITKAHS